MRKENQELLDLLLEGIGIDGARHKQWYLTQAIKKVSPSTWKELEAEEGEDLMGCPP